jgi:hypothetical protein
VPRECAGTQRRRCGLLRCDRGAGAEGVIAAMLLLKGEEGRGAVHGDRRADVHGREPQEEAGRTTESVGGPAIPLLPR